MPQEIGYFIISEAGEHERFFEEKAFVFGELKNSIGIFERLPSDLTSEAGEHERFFEEKAFVFGELKNSIGIFERLPSDLR